METSTNPNVAAFDRWIRTSFVQMNTDLEDQYFAQENRADVIGVGDALKEQILEEGRALIVPLMDEGNTDEGVDQAFDLLGNVGLYMAALRRHELTNPDRETKSPFAEASALAMHIGASVGVTPRFATSHLTTHNLAINGVQKSFTSLDDEFLFLNYNSCGVLAYKRAADALMRILPLGISNPVSLTLFEDAKNALDDVIKFNDILFTELDQQRFFYCVRPYYKPYRVGQHVYRGANAGDFAGINEIDMLLGLCRANDPYYAQILVDKMLFMMPYDQQSLRDCMRRTSLLQEFMDVADESAGEPWFQKNCAAFLKTCDAHGRTAAQHHDQLVNRFITTPADDLEERNLEGITASGPPLPVLINALERLRDLRLAAPRDDIETSHAQFSALRGALAKGAAA